MRLQILESQSENLVAVWECLVGAGEAVGKARETSGFEVGAAAWKEG